MPLTKEQFQKARNSGFTTEQIAGFEKRRESEAIESPSFMNQLKQALIDTPKTLVRGIAEPIIRDVLVRPLIGLESMISKQPPVESVKYPFPKFLGGDIEVKSVKTLHQAIGAGVQTGALLAGRKLPAPLMGAMFGGGAALEERQPTGGVVASTLTGAALGKGFEYVAGGGVGRTGKAIKGGVKKVIKFPKTIGRSIRKYKTLRKGSKFKKVRTDLTPLERVESLKKQAIKIRTEPLIKEKGQLQQTLKDISTKEKAILAKSKVAIEQNKVKLKQDVERLSGRLKEETTHLRDNIELASQRSALEGKRRFSQFAKDNSSSYGNKLDDIVNIAEKEGKLPTQKVLQNIFDKTDDEIAKTFIDTGAPLTKYSALKDKYLGGISAETNPEAQAIAKALGMGKRKIKDIGIDWSRVDVSRSQFKQPVQSKFVNLKELLQDMKSVSKAISSKAKGAERAFTDEDLVSVLFKKNVGEHMSQTYPEFAKLQKSYSPIIEQMKAGRKIFKPGAPYDLGTAPRVLAKPNIAEQRLIRELEKGTRGFSKGLGKISQPVTKAQQKLSGTERAYSIAKSKVEKLNLTERKELEQLLRMREEAFNLAKEKVTVKSMIRQKQIRENLRKRIEDLETGKFKGKISISKLGTRAKAVGREKKIAEGGGIGTMVSYLIRRIISRGVLR